MSEISGLDPTSAKGKVVKLTSKTQVSLEKTEKKEGVEKLETARETANVEIKMEEAKHAFALITEIREKIETAYEKLVSSQDK
jgi:flagellar hook-basal body complex protein FliE